MLLHLIQLEGSEFPSAIGVWTSTIKQFHTAHHTRFDIIKSEMMHLVVTHFNNKYQNVQRNMTFSLCL